MPRVVSDMVKSANLHKPNRHAVKPIRSSRAHDENHGDTAAVTRCSSPKRNAPYKPLVAKNYRPLSLPPLLQRRHELVSARVPGSDRPFVNGDRSGFLPLELHLQLLHSPVFHDLLTQRRFLLRVRRGDVRVHVREACSRRLCDARLTLARLMIVGAHRTRTRRSNLPG